MNRGGIGIGSASIVLVFAVLCLTIFALITFTTAQNDMALVKAETTLVSNYYAADVLAEQVLAQLLAEGTGAGTINDIEISSGWDGDIGAQVASFSCPVSAKAELFVEVALYDNDAYDILSWRMLDTGSWQADDSLSVWQGAEIDDGPGVSVDGGASLWLGK